jgi:NADPH:quinone reductase-like Zn-dependent oxidoreductase
MTSAIRLKQTGGPQVLGLEQVEQSAPGPGQAWIEQHAIGVNFLDVTQRNGAVPIPLPNGLGLEAAGIVTAVGPDVENVVVGDRVAYALGPLGGYATGRLYPANRLVKLPDDISFEDAAAVMFKGITAQYLIKRAWFRIRHFWVTQASESRRLLRPGFGSEVIGSGGGRPPQIKRVAAEEVRGPTASANAHGLARSSIPVGSCRCVR